MECTGGIVNSTTVWHEIVNHIHHTSGCLNICLLICQTLDIILVFCVFLCVRHCIWACSLALAFKVVAFCVSFLVYRGRFLMNPHWNVWSCCLRSGHSKTRRWELNSLTCQKSMFFSIIIFYYPEFCSFFFE